MVRTLGILAVLVAALAAIGAGPVKVQPVDGAAGNGIEIIGRGIASKADEELKKEVAKYARDNLFGVTGTLKPSGDVKFIRGGRCTENGRTGGVLEFRVHARAKIDVGTGPFTRKIWAVDTEQVWQVIALPKPGESGKVDVRVEQVSATASKERSAKTKHAEGFRDTVTKAIRAKLDRFAGERDLSTLLK